MAKIKQFGGKLGTPAVTEDPRPGNEDFYLYGVQHDKESLSPFYDKEANFGPGGGTYYSFMYPFGQAAAGNAEANAGNLDHFNLFANMRGMARPAHNYKVGQLQLTKQTTSVGGAVLPVDSNNLSNRYDVNAIWSLDKAYQLGSIINVTNSTNTFNTILAQMSSSHELDTSGNMDTTFIGWPQLPSSTSISDVNVSLTNRTNSLNYLNSGNIKQNGAYFVPKTYASGVTGIMQGSFTGTAANIFNPNYSWFALGNEWPTSYINSYGSQTNLAIYETPQLVGISAVDGKPIYLVTKKGLTTEGVQVKIYKVSYNGATVATAPTLTTLFDNTTVPTASGTSSGGNYLNNKYRTKFCSTWFTDPRDANKKCFYFPYYDNQSNYHPFVITWNTTNDTFARETDITVAAGGLSTTNLAIDISALKSDQGTMSADFTFNETFSFNNNRYVTVMHFDQREQYVANEGCRTFVTYLVNASNPKLLSYHSKVIIPKTAKNLVWLNDDHTLIGVFMTGAFNVYKFNNVTGWTSTVQIPENVYSCGRDATNRIFYLTASTKYGIAAYDTHLLTPNIPVTVNITPETNGYQYSGTPINSFLNVESLNAEGSRINTEVRLVIQGGSMTFSDGSILKTLYTSTSNVVQANTIITGSGFTNVVASVDI